MSLDCNLHVYVIVLCILRCTPSRSRHATDLGYLLAFLVVIKQGSF